MWIETHYGLVNLDKFLRIRLDNDRIIGKLPNGDESIIFLLEGKAKEIELIYKDIVNHSDALKKFARIEQ